MYKIGIEDFYHHVTMAWEKGKCNDKDDPGGATNDGVATHFITDFALSPEGAEFLKSIGIEPVFIMGYVNKKATVKTKIFSPSLLMSFTPGQCKSILVEKFWNQTGIKDIPCKLAAFATFDFSLNSGETRGIRYLQISANNKSKTTPALATDGALGPKSYKRLEEFVDPDKDYDLAMEVCKQREGFLRSLKTFSVYGRGWMNRVNALRAYIKEYPKWKI